MIEPSIEDVMNRSERDIVIPAEMVATVNENNNLQHVFLVLSKIKYSKIPVLDNDNHFKGLISLAMITDQMLTNEGIDGHRLENILVKDVMQTDVHAIYERENLEVILRYLVDENFLPYIDEDDVFKGIITRREILKEINFLTHNYDKYYHAESNHVVI
ncbi:cystathionine beta-synthase (CBS) domain protein [Lentilactobacillus senioris DSM 24302 = JCM 17472]|uniref:Cystathionine beta-synthase (CBS) domain protein n=1 Tax=Lentilactobacillus senioris DSM 24302 = JCM 17472 TaxID=1423802 RepID=A0A0R2CRT3_9LACO|nr:cyclic-di-AMP-binding protein CbpB [Lentilactobacillus senioris]KRM93698.1 cystathionine beta-synthase (CBS) domain protein [Lentilactobacillus senioris DSM 24302 = JCM 17472]